MILRRDVLKWAALGLGASVSAAGAASDPVPPAPMRFEAGDVLGRARELARKPFAAPSSELPAPFADLTYDQYVGIRQKPGSAIWADEKVGFALEPLHRGFIFSAPMRINLIENGQSHALGYEAARFDFGKLQVPANLPDVGFSGFRVLQFGPGGVLQDVAIFQGASFFRAIARGQNFGVTARALSLRTADPKGEEFPLLREVWIEKPSLANDALTIHALLDSESVTGAYRFTLRPGDVTIIDTECTLVSRTAIDALGLGTMAGMSLFGPLGRRPGDEVRAGVYEVGGLQVLNQNGEWLWRPAVNRDTLQLSSFVDPNPRGFGMLQRERRFPQFQDDDQHWELRPSLWIEPLGDWGEGSVVLVEIPSDAEINDNIICFWRPKAAMPANTEASYTYRQSFCWTPLERPTGAICTATRDGRGPGTKSHRFLVEFTSDAFADAAGVADLHPMISASAGTISGIRTFHSAANRTFRVHFDMEAGVPMTELRLVLERGGKPASETWLYRWTS